MAIQELRRVTGHPESMGRSNFSVDVTENFQTSFNGSTVMHGIENSREVTLKFSGRPEGAKREFEGLTLAYTSAAHVPQPLNLIKRQSEPSVGIMMQRVNGHSLNEDRSSENLHLLGEEAKALHALTVTGFGIITDGRAQFTTAEVYLQTEIDEALPYFYDNEKARGILQNLWLQARGTIIPKEPHFVHGDIIPTNAIHDGNGHVYVVDFENWRGGSPWEDIGIYLADNIKHNRPESELRNFMHGYMDNQELTDGQKQGILFYALLAQARVTGVYARHFPDRVGKSLNDLAKIVNLIESDLSNRG